MHSSKWQINPALSINDYPEQKKLVIGIQPPHLTEISDHYVEIKKIITILRKKNEFNYQQAVEVIRPHFSEAKEVFKDLEQLKLVIPQINANDRYARHELYYQFADAPNDAQEILASKSVLAIGMGGIGSTCSMLLAAAGVGHLVLADGDKLELSNLTRTTLFKQSDLGRLKIRCAEERLHERNQNVRISTLAQSLTRKTFAAYQRYAKKCDLIILSGDSCEQVHELSYELSKTNQVPIINSGYIEHWGVVGPLTIGANKRRESEALAFRKHKEETRQINSNYKAASYGPLNSLVSSITVNEVIRYFVGLPVKSMDHRLLINSFNYTQVWENWS